MNFYLSMSTNLGKSMTYPYKNLFCKFEQRKLDDIVMRKTFIPTSDGLIATPQKSLKLLTTLKIERCYENY